MLSEVPVFKFQYCSLLHYHSLALNIINKTLTLIQTFFSTSGMTESALWGTLEILGSHVGGQYPILTQHASELSANPKYKKLMIRRVNMSLK